MLKSKLEEEVETWAGFSFALRIEDRTAWDSMIGEAMEYKEAVERSGRIFDVEALFMAVLLVQRKRIASLRREKQALLSLSPK